jgi:hypothetical protein
LERGEEGLCDKERLLLELKLEEGCSEELAERTAERDKEGDSETLMDGLGEDELSSEEETARDAHALLDSDRVLETDDEKLDDSELEEE